MTPTKEIDKRMQLRAETGCPTPVMIKWFLVAQHHALSRLARCVLSLVTCHSVDWDLPGRKQRVGLWAHPLIWLTFVQDSANQKLVLKRQLATVAQLKNILRHHVGRCESTQPGRPSVDTHNECQLKRSDALRLGSKGRHMNREWVAAWQVTTGHSWQVYDYSYYSCIAASAVAYLFNIHDLSGSYDLAEMLLFVRVYTCTCVVF